MNRRENLRELVERLRQEGRATRGHDVPPGGWAPIYDEDGNPVPDPHPDEPTGVSKEDADRVRPPED